MFVSSNSMVVLGLIASMMHSVLAFSSGAAGCQEGASSVGGPHVYGGITSGNLTDGGFTVYLDGQPLTAGGTYSFTVGVDHTLQLKAKSTTYFLGFLFRLSNVATTALTVPPSVTIIQPASRCIIYDVPGITHVINLPKTDISAILMVETPTQDILLDVTVVGTFQQSHFYNNFNLNAVRGAPTPPTATPIAPTAKPVAKPVAKPSRKPTKKPTRKPTKPTRRPTKKPTRRPA